MATFITRLADHGSGTAIAVKDLVDMAGEVTTGGSRALADHAAPAADDAACLREIRRREAAGEVWIVGRTNLHELAYGVTGVNPWFGTPVNPLDPTRLPGGSSSGSAVAVATRDADVAIGTDTGGSVRIPAACCGVAGLKTSWGRVPTKGVWPLAPSLDTVGPLARDVAGLVLGMQLFERDFAVPTPAALRELRVGRVRTTAEPAIEAAVDRALAAAGLDVAPVELTGLDAAWNAANEILSAEAWRADRALLAAHPDGIGAGTAERIAAGADVDLARETAARRHQLRWQQDLDSVLAEVHVLALPTLLGFPPPLDATTFRANRLCLPFNLAGLPALALPVPCAGPLPASLQLVGPAYSEELLLALGAQVEAAVNAAAS